MADQISDEAQRVEKLVESGDSANVAKALLEDSSKFSNDDFKKMLTDLQGDNKAANDSFGGSRFPTLEITDNGVKMHDNVFSSMARSVLDAPSTTANAMTGDANQILNNSKK